MVVENYSGWHWLHKDPQIQGKIHARSRLHEIAKPTLIIMGEGDLSYFHNISTVLAGGIIAARKVVVPNVGHMVNMEAPDEVNNLLANFIIRPLQD
jgi:pimeloyl-ACP methyl ester carboxylesterase